MRRLVIASTLIASVAFAAPALAQSNSTLSGAAIGAGTGAVVAGPIGAVAGGVIGAVVGGPTFHRRSCWRDRRGYRRCR
jgi:osmotically inducible lipoprotein OsmB